MAFVVQSQGAGAMTLCPPGIFSWTLRDTIHKGAPEIFFIGDKQVQRVEKLRIFGCMSNPMQLE